MSKKKPTLQSVVTTKAMNRGRKLIGLPAQAGHSWSDWLLHLASEAWADLVGTGKPEETIPAGFPADIWRVIDGVLKARGGSKDENYNFWLSRTHGTVLPIMWEIQVDYQPNADINKVYSFEEAIEDALARAGHDLNIRIIPKPLRIQIDRYKPPAQRLCDYWKYIREQPINRFQAMPAVFWDNGSTKILELDLASPTAFSMGIFASAGGGKTQLSGALLLSACLANSPERLSLIIVDPKGVDFHFFNNLPHLAMPVISDVNHAMTVMSALIDEMERRKVNKDPGHNRILLYIDELADLIMVGGEDAVNMLIRLTQRGRGVGISVIVSSQRAVKGCPASVLNNLNTRLVGRMGSASESTFATSIDGSTCHRLPGYGAFECYNMEYPRGVRVQAFYIGDSKLKTYQRIVDSFVNDIIARWGGATSHWPNHSPKAPSAQHAEETPAANDQTPNGKKARGVDPLSDLGFVAELRKRYLDDPTAFCINTLREEYFDFYEVSVNGKRAKPLFERFVKMMLQSERAF